MPRTHAALALLLIPAAAAQVLDADTPPPTLDDVMASVVTVEFDETPLEDALATLSEMAGVNLIVDWPRLREARVEPDTPVTLTLREVPAASVLRFTLRLVDFGAEPLSAGLMDDVVFVTFDRFHSLNTDIRLYDIRPLIRGADPLQALRDEVLQRLADEHRGRVQADRASLFFAVNEHPVRRPRSRNSPRSMRGSPVAPGGGCTTTRKPRSAPHSPTTSSTSSRRPPATRSSGSTTAATSPRSTRRPASSSSAPRPRTTGTSTTRSPCCTTGSCPLGD